MRLLRKMKTRGKFAQPSASSDASASPASAGPARRGRLSRMKTVSAAAMTRLMDRLRPRQDRVLPPGKVSKDTRARARAAFATYDANENGYLSFKEVHDAVKMLADEAGFPVHFTAKHFEEIFEATDTNKDSQVDIEEFLRLYADFTDWAQTESEREAQAAQNAAWTHEERST